MKLNRAGLIEGEFRGTAAATGVRFESGMTSTILRPGCFKETIVDDFDRILILWQHDPTEPIGRPVSLGETREGLEFVAELSDTQRGKEALELLRRSVEKSRQSRHAFGLSQCQRNLARMLLGLDRGDEALPHLLESADTFRQLRDRAAE